jgi:hypothetical protein
MQALISAGYAWDSFAVFLFYGYGNKVSTLINKKEKNFLKYKEIQKAAVAKSYMTNVLLIDD